ncbi:hypothetical protein OB13_19845 [Pontibacter sp. HJ8]
MHTNDSRQAPSLDIDEMGRENGTRYQDVSAEQVQPTASLQERICDRLGLHDLHWNTEPFLTYTALTARVVYAVSK